MTGRASTTECAPIERAMVTGGAGFIGSALVRRLCAVGVDTLVFDALIGAGRLANLAGVSGHAFVQLDVRDRPAISGALAAFQPQVVFHLAAETHVDRSIDDARPFVDTNVVGTLTLLEALRAAAEPRPLLVHVSTDEVFGSTPPGARAAADAPYAPRSPYAASKAAADHLVSAFAHTYGVPALIAHPCNVYGPRQSPDKLIPLMILAALQGRQLPIYGDGAQTRDWIFVDDLCEGLIAAAAQGAPGGRYLFSGGAERANLSLVEAICDLVDRLAPTAEPRRNLIAHVADRPGHDRRYAMDGADTAAALDWRARTPLDAGLERTVRWYLDNEEWWRPLLDAGLGRRRAGLP